MKKLKISKKRFLAISFVMAMCLSAMMVVPVAAHSDQVNFGPIHFAWGHSCSGSSSCSSITFGGGGNTYVISGSTSKVSGNLNSVRVSVHVQIRCNWNGYWSSPVVQGSSSVNAITGSSPFPVGDPRPYIDSWHHGAALDASGFVIPGTSDSKTICH